MAATPTRPTVGQGLFVHEHGDDIYTAAKLEEFPLPPLGPKDVLVKMLAAPINPSDVLSITGTYGDIPPRPFVLGFEGAGSIIEIGTEVTSVAVGDWVLPGKPKFGTWRTHGIVDESMVAKIDKRLGFKAAATLTVNPSTAYLMLTDMVDLKPGDTVIQNGANSAVGQMLIQIAAQMGIRTINVVRNRANLQDLVTKLQGFGADVVITDDDLKKRASDDKWGSEGLAKPKMAIDCVGGELGSEMVRHLPPGGTLVSYGSMTGQPLTVSPLPLIFKDITVKGFWLLTVFMKTGKSRLQEEVFPYIGKLAAEGKFKFPEVELFAIQDYKEALKRATAGFTNLKQLLVMDESLLK